MTEVGKLRSENAALEREVTLKEADLELLKQRDTIMKQIDAEKKQRLQEEKLVLEELQNNVFREKRQFCDKVHEFTEEYGLLTAMKRREEQGYQKLNEGMCTNLTQEVKRLEQDVAALESEVSSVNADQKLSGMRLLTVQEENQRLVQEQPEGNDFRRLQELKQEIEALEMQCRTEQRELDWQELVIQTQVRSLEYGNRTEVNTAEPGPVEEVQSTFYSCQGSSSSKPAHRLFVPKAPSKMSHELEKKLSELLAGTRKS